MRCDALRCAAAWRRRDLPRRGLDTGMMNRPAVNFPRRPAGLCVKLASFCTPVSGQPPLGRRRRREAATVLRRARCGSAARWARARSLGWGREAPQEIMGRKVCSFLPSFVASNPNAEPADPARPGSSPLCGFKSRVWPAVGAPSVKGLSLVNPSPGLAGLGRALRPLPAGRAARPRPKPWPFQTESVHLGKPYPAF